MVIPCPSRPWPYSGPRLYEFCIAVALKQRRPTEAHCAWVGGVSLAVMNWKSLTAGWKVTTEVTAWGGPPTPISAARKITATTAAVRRMTERRGAKFISSLLLMCQSLSAPGPIKKWCHEVLRLSLPWRTGSHWALFNAPYPSPSLGCRIAGTSPTQERTWGPIDLETHSRIRLNDRAL